MVVIAVMGLALLAAAVGATLANDSSSPDTSARKDSTASAAERSRGCARPYSDASPWNTPIGGSPRVAPDSARHISALEGVLTSDPTQYTYPVYEVSRRTRRQSVRVRNVYSDVTAGGRRLTVRKGPTIRLPIPAGARAAEGSDAQIILLDRDTGDEWGAWRLSREGGRWGMENGYHYNTRWSGVPPRAADGQTFGSRGAGVPYLAGLVRPCELRRGRIDHALAFAYNFPSPAHVYPATKSDGSGDRAADMPEGTRMQLDPSLTAQRLREMGCRGPCLTIARALQRYGMYVIDNSGRPKVILEYADTARWRGFVDSETVSPIPLSAFRVLRPCRPGSRC
jgi:hypothetical protein